MKRYRKEYKKCQIKKKYTYTQLTIIVSNVNNVYIEDTYC